MALKKGPLIFIILALSTSLWGAADLPAKAVGKKANIFVITLQVDGKDRNFIVDTGCSVSIVSPHIFTNALPVGRESDTLLSSKTHMDMILVELDIAGKHITERVFRADLSGVSEALATPIDGLIGQDVLSHFTSVTLNFKTHHLILE